MKTPIKFLAIGLCSILCTARVFNCDVSEDTNALLKQVNTSANSEFDAAELRAQNVGPRLRVGIVSGFHPSEAGHATYALALNEMYAKHQGYTFKILSGANDMTEEVEEKVAFHNPFRNWIAFLRTALQT